MALPVDEAYNVRYWPWITCGETEDRYFVCYVMTRPLLSSCFYWGHPPQLMSEGMGMNIHQVGLQTAEPAFC